MPGKPIGVFVLLSSGERWMFSREPNLNEALRTARTLRIEVPSLSPGPLPLLPRWRVWLAEPARVGSRRQQ